MSSPPAPSSTSMSFPDTSPPPSSFTPPAHATTPSLLPLHPPPSSSPAAPLHPSHHPTRSPESDLALSEYALAHTHLLAESQAETKQAVADLAMAKLRRINQGLRVGLSDATSGWRESVVLSKTMTEKCESLEGQVASLQTDLKSKDSNFSSLEDQNAALRSSADKLRAEGDEVLREYEVIGRAKEAVERKLAAAEESLKDARAEIDDLKAEREKALEVSQERDDLAQELESLKNESQRRRHKGSSPRRGAAHSPAPPPVPASPLPAPPPLPPGDVHASIARSIALRFESAIRERIEQRSLAEVKLIEDAVKKAIQGIKASTIDDRKMGKKKSRSRGPAKKIVRKKVSGGKEKEETRIRISRSKARRI